jgi:hypothetical protein
VRRAAAQAQLAASLFLLLEDVFDNDPNTNLTPLECCRFELAATGILDECNDNFEAEKVLLDQGHTFIRNEHPLNYALRYRFMSFIANRWVKRYTEDVWHSVGPWSSSSNEMTFEPVNDFTRSWFAQGFVYRIGAVPLLLSFSIVIFALLPIAWIVQLCFGDHPLQHPSEGHSDDALGRASSGAAKLAVRAGVVSGKSNGRLIYPGRWPRRMYAYTIFVDSSTQ